MKSCGTCAYIHSDPFVSPCPFCQKGSHYKEYIWPPTLSKRVKTDKLIAACHKQRDRARKAEKEKKDLELELEDFYEGIC
jgi:hypothetical protein